MFERIQKWYQQGLWTQSMVEQAMRKGLLTQKQAENILQQGGSV